MRTSSALPAFGNLICNVAAWSPVAGWVPTACQVLFKGHAIYWGYYLWAWFCGGGSP